MTGRGQLRSTNIAVAEIAYSTTSCVHQIDYTVNKLIIPFKQGLTFASVYTIHDMILAA